MELISGVGCVEFHFRPFGDSVNVSAREVHGLHRTYHRHRNHFGRTRWDSLVTRLKWKLGSSVWRSATLDARLVHGLRQTYRRLGNSIGGTRWNS
jgi:hypothetical protein